MTRNKLIEELQAYRGEEAEMQCVTPTIQLLQNNPDCFWRYDFEPGHMTGSSLVINQTGDKVLLNHHAIYNRWVTFGGHADGDEDIRAVALREAFEESGIAEEHITFVTTDFFDVDIHPIAANPKKNEPAHYHFDIVFLFRSATENFTISDESTDLRWCTYDEAKTLLRPQSDRRMTRVIEKWKTLDAR
jgi:8-oxo-dGTP pyrophosphatase MutT (NUDIX family)